MQYIQAFNFKVCYIPDIKNCVANILSRKSIGAFNLVKLNNLDIINLNTQIDININYLYINQDIAKDSKYKVVLISNSQTNKLYQIIEFIAYRVFLKFKSNSTKRAFINNINQFII